MPDPVARLNAALEGRYAIERELGEGGMATVYLAEDLKSHDQSNFQPELLSEEPLLDRLGTPVDGLGHSCRLQRPW